MTEHVTPGRLDGVADLDAARADRRGIPEAVYGPGKSVDQLVAIATALRERDDGRVALFTRMDAPRAAAVVGALPGARWDEQSGLLAWPGAAPEPRGGLVVVACAGTSDIPVAREAWLTARHLGCRAELVVDVGVAGLDRVLARRGLLARAAVVVVAAGMDGALASVIAGLVPAPVVAVPTSVGYGAAFEGMAALLAMLNACAPGVAVVNIDNGYGAGHLAAQIAHTNLDRTGRQED